MLFWLSYPFILFSDLYSENRISLRLSISVPKQFLERLITPEIKNNEDEYQTMGFLNDGVDVDSEGFMSPICHQTSTFRRVFETTFRGQISIPLA